MSAYLAKAARTLDKSGPTVRWLHIIGMGMCFLWVCFMFIDVLMRYVFDRPYAGGQDVSEVILIIVIFAGVAHAQLTGKHISVDVITSQISRRSATVIESITSLLSLCVVGVMVWRGVVNTIEFAGKGSMSPMIGIPLAPTAALIPIGGALLFILLLRDYFKKLGEAAEYHYKGYTWLVMLGVPIIVIVLSGLWIQALIPGPDPIIKGLIGLVISFVLIFLGMPIAFALAMVGFIFMGNLISAESGLSSLGSGLYWHLASYDWTVVALFILMGYFIVHSRLGMDAYDTAYKWVGHLRGGLGIATVGASTALAAIVGDPVASTVTLGTVALKEMRKYKYDLGMSTGVICAGATLGPMIPPSVVLIIYGILAEESIGQLFIAGIIPGLMLAFSFIVVVYTLCRINPDIGPPGEKSSWSARLVSLRSAGPILLLFLVVIGGIYAGVFSAMEGGGIGAFCAFLIALAMRRLNWNVFWEALLDGGKLISTLLLLIGCALVFGNFLAAANVTTVMSEFVHGLAISPLIIVACILFVFLILGCLIDAPVIMLLFVPILVPVAETMGIDLLWFGILIVLMANLGAITPPYALIIFLLRGLAPDIPVGVMYRGVLPFVLSTLVVVILLFFFPILITYLPNLLMR